MRLSEEVRQLLQQGREDAVAEIAAADPRALRPLVGRLWDSDREIRLRAARVIGHAAASHPDLGVDLIRRLMWALNDESATNGVHAVPALGEIGRQAPDLLEPFVPSIVALAWDDGLRLELLRALTAAAESNPGAVAKQFERMAQWVDRSRPEEREQHDRLAAAIGKESGDGE
jgi:hypothetical protein